MDIAKDLFASAKEGGKVDERVEFLRLNESVQVEVEGETVEIKKPNGPHRIKIVSAGMGKGKNGFTGEEQDEMQMVVVEGSRQKLWNVAVKNKQGNLNYLIESLIDVEIGDEIIVESKKKSKGQGYYTDIRKVARVGASASVEVPVIQLNEDDGDSEGDMPPMGNGADIPAKKVPF